MGVVTISYVKLCLVRMGEVRLGKSMRPETLTALTVSV